MDIEGQVCLTIFCLLAVLERHFLLVVVSAVEFVLKGNYLPFVCIPVCLGYLTLIKLLR